MPDLKERLLAELVELRQGVGLNPRRVREQPILFERLGKGSSGEPAQLLVELVRLISEPLQRKAVEWSFRLTGTKGSTLTARWDDLRKELEKEEKRSYSLQTVRRLTDKGLKDLADLVLRFSAEGSVEVPTSQRIADLELTVSMMGRIIYSLMKELPEWRRADIDQSIQADQESYELSLAKVVWRGSDNGKAAISSFDSVVERLGDVDDEINSLEVLRYMLPPAKADLGPDGLDMGSVDSFGEADGFPKSE